MGVLPQVPPQILCASYFSRDPVGATGYLLGKYDLHDCPGDPRYRAPLLAWQQTERGKNLSVLVQTVCCLGLIRWDLCTAKAFDADRQGDFPSLLSIEKRAVTIFQL
jgi:hypothetical protein